MPPLPPLVIGSLIGAGASILGNLFNAGSTVSANTQNVAIAKMNNKFNEQMLQKQMDYNTEMWNKQNVYNSASAQRDRLEAAGLNPYMMLNGGNAGTAQAAGGITPPTATPVHVAAPQVDFSGIGDSLSTFLSPDAKLKQEQAEGIRIENKFKAAEIIASLGETISRTKNNDVQQQLMQIQRSLALETFNSDVAYKQNMVREQELRLDQIYIQNSIQSKELANLDEKIRLELALLGAQIISQKASAGASYASAKAAYASALVSRAQAANIKLSTKQAEAMFDDNVSRNHNDLIRSTYDTQTARHLTDKAKWEAISAEHNSGPRDAWQHGWYQGTKVGERFEK